MSRSNVRQIPLLMAAGLILLTATVAAADEAFDASARMLRRAVTPQRDGMHLVLLSSLRQLRDPSLRPLFRDLVDAPDWMMQVHAVLGLAESESPRRLNPKLLLQVEPRSQEAILANSIDLDLVGTDQLTEMVGWQGLSPMTRVMLAAELTLRAAGAVEMDLAALADDDDARVRTLAACLRVQQGHANAVGALNDVIFGDEAQRDRRLAWALDAIGQYRLTALTGWVDQVFDRLAEEERLQRDVVFALLQLAPERGLARWKQALGQEASFPRRVHFAMMLVVQAEALDPEAFRLLAGDEPLIRRLADVGRARATGGEITPAMTALYDLGNTRATELVLTEAKNLDDASAAAVYRHMLDRLASDAPGREAQSAAAVAAVARLYAIDPAAVHERLTRAEAGSLLQQVLLLGLLEVRRPDVTGVLEQLRFEGFSRSDSLALLLWARHAETLTSAQRQRLGIIASGGGRVSEPLQVQAAWLYLRQTGATDAALARVLTP